MIVLCWRGRGRPLFAPATAALPVEYFRLCYAVGVEGTLGLRFGSSRSASEAALLQSCDDNANPTRLGQACK